MPKVTRCLRCQEVFHRVGAEGLCPQCDDKAAQCARKVDDFLAHHDTHDVATIVGATGAPRAFVESYLAGESRDTAMTAQHVHVPPCQRCGAAPAALGQHCKRCALELRRQVHTVVQDPPQQAPAPSASMAVERRSRSTGTGRGG